MTTVESPERMPERVLEITRSKTIDSYMQSSANSSTSKVANQTTRSVMKPMPLGLEQRTIPSASKQNQTGAKFPTTSKTVKQMQR